MHVKDEAIEGFCTHIFRDGCSEPKKEISAVGHICSQVRQQREFLKKRLAGMVGDDERDLQVSFAPSPSRQYSPGICSRLAKIEIESTACTDGSKYSLGRRLESFDVHCEGRIFPSGLTHLFVNRRFDEIFSFTYTILTPYARCRVSI